METRADFLSTLETFFFASALSTNKQKNQLSFPSMLLQSFFTIFIIFAHEVVNFRNRQSFVVRSTKTLLK